MLVGYKFISIINNMGIVFWFMVICIVSLCVKLGLYIFRSQIKKLDENSELLKYIRLEKNISGSLYNYMAVNQIISMTSLALYLRYEYFETGCFDLICFRSDVMISATKLVKLEIIVAIILFIGSLVHFWRSLVLMHRHKWLGFQGQLNQSRFMYGKEHTRLMNSSFGRGHD